MNQTIRIIGGKYRGRKLHFPNEKGLRPTTDRVRETLFNWLMHDIRGACVLDAFAGSGALGFEALSRGASEVVMVENSSQVIASLRKQADRFDASNLDIVFQDVLAYLQMTNRMFDIVFLDPPFDHHLLQPAIDLLINKKRIKPNGLIYIETSLKQPFLSDSLTLLKEKAAGDVCYRLLKR